MKNIYLFFVGLLLSGTGVSQNIPIPLRSEIYNFAVGDTLEYISVYYDETRTNESYIQNVYFSKDNTGNHAITYRYKSTKIYNTANEGRPDSAPVIDTVSYEVVALDSNLFYDIPNYADSNPAEPTTISTGISTANGDTTYGWASGYATPCVDGSYVSYSDSQEFQKGLGLIYTGSQTPVSYCFYVTWTQLVYYHKANGKQSGTALNFAAGIRELPVTNTAKLFPNPASNNFQIQFSSQPPDKTYLQIYTSLGQQVMEKELNSSSTSINRGELSNGIYFWQVIQGKEILQKGKLILQ